MRVSSKSWHYRLLKFGNRHRIMPSSLCPYFWAVMLKLFCTFLIVGFMALALIILPIVWFKTGDPVAGGLSLVPYVGVGMMAVGSLLSWIADKHRDYRLAKFQAKRLVDGNGKPIHAYNPQEHLFIEFFKAVKNRVCPKIEYED